MLELPNLEILGIEDLGATLAPLGVRYCTHHCPLIEIVLRYTQIEMLPKKACEGESPRKQRANELEWSQYCASHNVCIDTVLEVHGRWPL